ncbi:hypothetical protein RvY_18956 [Ramazzottius varieornatus]|uniref:SART-1 family protein n=1 Tax=Ramazzottius varieornatus TaxID=947166 RepID=A0A1D1WBX9_RAMVA|nr:hypothetical protein RvY_18956 [Ramazzottius varieornatus]
MESRGDDKERKRRSKRDKADLDRPDRSSSGKGEEQRHGKEHKSAKKSKRSKRSRSRSPLDREVSGATETKVKPATGNANPLSPSQTFDNTRLDKSDKPSRSTKLPLISEASAESSNTVGDGVGGGGGGHQEELSIEETNKIRTKLGLKPLQVGGAGKGGDGLEASSSKKEDVHAPAVNLAEVKRTTTTREKLETLKEKKKLERKLRSVKKLGDGDEEESAAAWIEKNRRIVEERKKAEEREKLQEEMDAQNDQEDVSRRQRRYTAQDLAGLKVEHDMERFQEGRDVILTLKDQYILGEDGAEDVLVSTALSEEERLKKNLENKKKKATYNPYENADELDQFGNLAPPQMLKKYDEVIGGEKKGAFVLEAGGQTLAASGGPRPSGVGERQTVDISQLQDLLSAPRNLAREYFTEEEVASKFKKVKKPRGAGGGRHSGRAAREEADEEEQPVAPSSRSVVIDDERDDVHLQLAVNRTLRMRQQAELISVKMEPDIDVKMENEEEAMGDNGNTVYLNDTSEFCRTVGGFSRHKASAAQADTEATSYLVQPMEVESSAFYRDLLDDDREEVKGGWSEVQFEAEPANLGSDDEEDARPTGNKGRREGNGHRKQAASILDEEPTADRGVAAALQLVHNKGYIERTVDKKPQSLLPPGKQSSIPQQSYFVEDKILEHDERRPSRHDRYAGPTVPFKEKAGYQPSFKLAYHDATGRSLSEKEAFRDLSHKFHGKTQGKTKTEKREKKVNELQMLKSMSSTDTPLNTVHKMKLKQQELQTPYILLSGAATAKGPTPISKRPTNIGH